MVYEYDSMSNDWQQIGQEINGIASFDQFGYSVSMNDVGDRIAAGTLNGGYARVFEYDQICDDWIR